MKWYTDKALEIFALDSVENIDDYMKSVYGDKCFKFEFDIDENYKCQMKMNATKHIMKEDPEFLTYSKSEQLAKIKNSLFKYCEHLHWKGHFKNRNDLY